MPPNLKKKNRSGMGVTRIKMIKLGSDKKPHRQTSGKAPIEEGDAEEDLMYLWSKIGMIITCRYHIRKSALSSPLDYATKEC